MPKSFPFAVILWRKITFSFRIQPQKCHAWRDTTYETSRTKIIINESETCSNPRKVFTFLLEFRMAWYGRRLERVLYYYTVVCCNGCLCSLLFVAFYDQETNKGGSVERAKNNARRVPPEVLYGLLLDNNEHYHCLYSQRCQKHPFPRVR